MWQRSYEDHPGNWRAEEPNQRLQSKLGEHSCRCGRWFALSCEYNAGGCSAVQLIFADRCWLSTHLGSDFIKTSTGKETTNATLEVAFVMCSAIKKWHEETGQKVYFWGESHSHWFWWMVQVGFKPAGGIKTPLEALGYVALINDVSSSVLFVYCWLFHVCVHEIVLLLKFVGRVDYADSILLGITSRNSLLAYMGFYYCLIWHKQARSKRKRHRDYQRILLLRFLL